METREHTVKVSLTFQDWIGALNNLCHEKVGLCVDDLPDDNWYGYWDTGFSPAEALEAYADEYEDEFGDLVEALR